MNGDGYKEERAAVKRAAKEWTDWKNAHPAAYQQQLENEAREDQRMKADHEQDRQTQVDNLMKQLKEIQNMGPDLVAMMKFNQKDQEDQDSILANVKSPEPNNDPQRETKLRPGSQTKWVLDPVRSNCVNERCSKPFTMWVWKHHCRKCGDIFCDTCCPKRFGKRTCLDTLGCEARVPYNHVY